jgi:hypothetical protein
MKPFQTRRRAARGQALVELAIVLPIVLVLCCGAVAVVQLARTQMALETAASATALVGARGLDASQACLAAHRELGTVISESSGLISAEMTDELRGACVGPLPESNLMPAGLGSGSFSLWFGYGAQDDTFCRVGSSSKLRVPTDGDMVATLVYRPDLEWIPVVGSWLSPRLASTAIDKIDPFRSRDPLADSAGDSC